MSHGLDRRISRARTSFASFKLEVELGRGFLTMAGIKLGVRAVWGRAGWCGEAGQDTRRPAACRVAALIGPRAPRAIICEIYSDRVTPETPELTLFSHYRTSIHFLLIVHDAMQF